MRRIIFPLLVLVVSCQAAFGKSVDESTAKTIGSNFFITQGKSVKPSDLLVSYQATSNVNGNTVTDFYVFNAGNSGFVIVSGDDRVAPVLGYDLESTFSYNSLYVNINGWLNNYKNEINSVIKNSVDQSTGTMQKWAALSHGGPASAARTTSTTNVAPLIHCAWNQTPYVNALCPYSTTDSAFAVTGCVATAMAQVMKYWGWPVTGSGSHSYHSSFGTLSANYAAETYKWDSMPNLVSDTNWFVAKLMSDAGISVNMNYSVTESGAYVTEASSPITNCAQYALQTYFSYNTTTIQGIDRGSYSDDSDWVHLLKSEINAKRPVMYTGDGSDGGHCFLADGYSANNNIHFNWGWGGMSNGYFTVENLDPDATDFNSDQTLIIGIMPDTVTIPPVAPTPSVVNQVAANTSVTIYPNPAMDVININLQGTVASQVRVTDLQGRTLTSVTPASTATMVTIPVSELAEGMYLVQVQTTQGIVTKKIVVAR